MIFAVYLSKEGSLEFIMEKFQLKDSEILNLYNDENFSENITAVYGFEELFRKWKKEGKNILEETKLFLTDFDGIIATKQSGLGLVPMDSFERELEEETGRACCEIAKKCQEMYRIFYSVGQRIK